MFAQRLKDSRERIGYSQVELGERIGIEGRAVYRY
jgi:DNA-binding XRE family transcriptional regulator